MATHDVPMRVNLRKNTDAKSAQYGHLYPYIDRTGTIDIRGLIKYIASRNTNFGRETVEGVTTLFSETIFDMLSIGVAVKLTSIGTFYPTFTSRKGGVTSVEEAKKLGADNLIEGVHVRFLPDSTKLDAITSRKFKERCVLRLSMLQTVTKKMVEGKEKKFFTYTPIYQEDKVEPEP